MRALLLAAGMGKRLAPASGGIPKALAIAGGRPLVAHQIDTLLSAGFTPEQLIVVGGCDHAAVADVARSMVPTATIVENTQFHHQNLLSMLAARKHLSDGFLMVNVDHLMPYAVHGLLVDHPAPIVAAVDNDRPIGADDMKVALGDDGNIAAISKQLTSWDVGYIGMTRVHAESVPRYLQTADAVLDSIGPQKAVVEMILGAMAQTDQPPAVCDCSGFTWCEVDTPDELAAAEAALSSITDFFGQKGLS